MAFIILFTGLYLTVRLRFFQFTHLGKAIASAFRRGDGRDGVSPFQATATALGSSIGTANIAGVAGAIAAGGPGAVFWMWAAALFGMATKAAEIILAMKYRDTRVSPPEGGPILYIERGLGRIARPLADAFALFGCAAAVVGTALVQSNTIALSVWDLVSGTGLSRRAVLAFSGVAAAALTGAVITGGAKRIGRFSERAVPFMAALYISASLAVIIVFRGRLTRALGEIVSSAFGARGIAGGVCGISFKKALSVGTARGVYSNEAGVGSSPMAHAGSAETDPVRQGLLGIFEVFADTMVMCSMTALVILTSGVPLETGLVSGTALALSAFSAVFGRAAAPFLSAAALLFAFTSLTGWSLYGERCAKRLFGCRSTAYYRAAYLAAIPIGAVVGMGRAWRIGEALTYLMALPNLVALILLSGEAAREVRLYKMFEKSSDRRYNKG